MNGSSTRCVRNVAVLLGALALLASMAQAAEPVTLSNGVPVTGLSGGASSETFYKIEVPAGQDDLEIVISGGTGDADLYVRKDSPPTTTSYDYRPYEVGNDETVTVTNPAAGTWHIMLRGYNAYSGVTLKATYSAAITIVTLANGVPVTGLAGATSSEKYFKIDVPAGQSKLEIIMSGGTGDADLYVKKDAMPTTTVYDHRPFLFGNNETVTVNNPAAGTWYIMIRGYEAYTGVTLAASYGGGIGTELQNGVPVTNLSGAQHSEKIYRITVPADRTNLEIMMWGGTPDADLYVKYGSRPTVSDYDYRPFLAGNEETVSINAPAVGTWYVMIRGYSAYSGVSLKATFGDVLTLTDEVPVPNLAAPLDSERFYKIEVPSGQDNLLIRTFGGTGNVDVYIKRGAKPTTANSDHRLNQPGNAESISIGSPQGGTWYVMLKARQAYTGVTILADYSFLGTVSLLTNGVPVTDISGGEGSERFYRLVVPSDRTKLVIEMSGGTGDADMYVKRGAIPTTTEYDYRPYAIGNNESITINNPVGDDWFIMIRGYHAYSGLTLVATHSADGGGGGDTVTTLQNGVPVTSLADGVNGQKFYKIDVPAGQAKLEIQMSGGTGDADLYVRKGSKPTLTEWDHRPYLIGNDETVTVDNPAAATWYIMLHAYGAYTNVTLKATYLPVADAVTPLANGVPVPGLSGTAGDEKHYKIDVPAGQVFLNVELAGGSGDADLYVRKGSKPTISSWDYRPYLIGNDEKVEIANPAAATWYVMVRGYQAYSGATLVATYGIAGNDFTSDPDCVALWRLEPSKLIVDSIGTNNVVNTGVAEETTAQQEGDGCGDWEADESDNMLIEDLDLDPGFPLRNGDANKKISVCAWFKAESLVGTTSRSVLTKGRNGKRSFDIGVDADEITGYYVYLSTGYDSGNSSQQVFHNDTTASKITVGTWFHVGVTLDGTSKAYRIRLYNANTDSVTEKTGTVKFDVNVEDGPLTLGNFFGSVGFWDGLIDEVVVFKDILTADEIDLIRQDSYSKP